MRLLSKLERVLIVLLSLAGFFFLAKCKVSADRIAQSSLKSEIEPSRHRPFAKTLKFSCSTIDGEGVPEHLASGIVVGPNTILTSAHLFFADVLSFPRHYDLLGYESAEVYIHPKHSYDSVTPFDIAAIITRDHIKSGTDHLPLADLREFKFTKGTKMSLTGMGHFDCDNRKSRQVMATKFLTFQGVDQSIFSELLLLTDDDTAHVGSNKPCSGDSGAGLYVLEDGRPKNVVGIFTASLHNRYFAVNLQNPDVVSFLCGLRRVGAEINMDGPLGSWSDLCHNKEGLNHAPPTFKEYKKRNNADTLGPC